jgi:hypothetical protein
LGGGLTRTHGAHLAAASPACFAWIATPGGVLARCAALPLSTPVAPLASAERRLVLPCGCKQVADASSCLTAQARRPSMCQQRVLHQRLASNRRNNASASVLCAHTTCGGTSYIGVACISTCCIETARAGTASTRHSMQHMRTITPHEVCSQTQGVQAETGHVVENRGRAGRRTACSQVQAVAPIPCPVTLPGGGLECKCAVATQLSL